MLSISRRAWVFAVAVLVADPCRSCITTSAFSRIAICRARSISALRRDYRCQSFIPFTSDGPLFNLSERSMLILADLFSCCWRRVSATRFTHDTNWIVNK